MTTLRDRLWLATARQAVEEIRPYVENLREERVARQPNSHFFADMADDGLLHLIVRFGNADDADLILYPRGSGGPLTAIELRADEIAITLSGVQHRMAIAAETKDVVRFIRDVAAHAVGTASQAASDDTPHP